jgi:hypothetical protein
MNYLHGDEAQRDQAEIAGALRALPRLVPPKDLTTRLRVVASRESKQRRIHETWDSWVCHQRERAALWFNNVMRPFAIPAAGGVLSTMAFLMLLAAQYPMKVSASTVADPPVGEYVEAVFIRLGPISLETQEAVVDVTVDSAGRFLDCEIADDGIPFHDRVKLEQRARQALLYADFEPARRFGVPVSGGKVRLAFRHGTIDVLG